MVIPLLLLLVTVGFGVADDRVTDDNFLEERFLGAEEVAIVEATVDEEDVERPCTGCMFEGYLTAKYPPITIARKTIEKIIRENVASGFIRII
jgi:hypothetical protein